jgi:Holliday junction resolvase-like predicted endonuclease
MEIDIIAPNLSTVAFVEVKARTYTKDTLDTAPPPGNAVRNEKQRLTRKAAKDYLWQHPTKKQPRMDVIEVWLVRDEKNSKPKVAKINHIKAAY